MAKNIVPKEIIEKQIYLIRGQKVMLSTHLSELYEIEPKALMQAVRRNIDRFPDDFMFQLSKKEMAFQRSQIVTFDGLSDRRIMHSKYPVFAFTEQGVAMLSSVLRTKKAVKVNINIMRAFVQLRELLASHKELANKLGKLERKYDAQFKVVFDAIRKILGPEKGSKRKIGF